jgi:hypothetical protein
VNALDTVRLIQEGQARADRWQAAFPSLYQAIAMTIPAHLVGRYTAQEWATTVAVFMEEGEAPITAAERLSRYMALHAERHDSTPTLASVQKRAADRHLKG